MATEGTRHQDATGRSHLKASEDPRDITVPLYETDFNVWPQQQAAALRAKDWKALESTAWWRRSRTWDVRNGMPFGAICASCYCTC